MTGDISEVKGQLAAGKVRAVAVLSPERLPTDPDIPTAKEQGYDAIGANWRGFYIPKGVSDDVHKTWGDIMAKLYESDEWKQAMEANGLAPFYNGGADFDDFVRKEHRRYPGAVPGSRSAQIKARSRLGWEAGGY